MARASIDYILYSADGGEVEHSLLQPAYFKSRPFVPAKDKELSLFNFQPHESGLGFELWEMVLEKTKRCYLILSHLL